MTPSPPGSPIRWGVGSLRFELASDDVTVRTLAGSVFRPWTVTDGGPASVSWRIDRLNGATAIPGWRVRPSTGVDVTMPSAERAVGAVEFGAVAALVDSPLAVVHGALVAWDDVGVLLAGRGEAGKSTLGCALWERGAALLGDDVALVDPVPATASPGPRRVSLRETSRSLLGDPFFTRIQRGSSSAPRRDAYLFHPDEIQPFSRPGSVKLGAVVFLARREAVVAPAQAASIPAAHALLALLPYTNLRSRGTTGEAIRILAPLVDRVPAFDLGRGPIAEMAEVVERLVAVAGRHQG